VSEEALAQWGAVAPEANKNLIIIIIINNNNSKMYYVERVCSDMR